MNKFKRGDRVTAVGCPSVEWCVEGCVWTAHLGTIYDCGGAGRQRNFKESELVFAATSEPASETVVQIICEDAQRCPEPDVYCSYKAPIKDNGQRVVCESCGKHNLVLIEPPSPWPVGTKVCLSADRTNDYTVASRADFAADVLKTGRVPLDGQDIPLRSPSGRLAFGSPLYFERQESVKPHCTRCSHFRGLHMTCVGTTQSTIKANLLDAACSEFAFKSIEAPRETQEQKVSPCAFKVGDRVRYKPTGTLGIVKNVHYSSTSAHTFVSVNFDAPVVERDIVQTYTHEWGEHFRHFYSPRGHHDESAIFSRHSENSEDLEVVDESPYKKDIASDMPIAKAVSREIMRKYPAPAPSASRSVPGEDRSITLDTHRASGVFLDAPCRKHGRRWCSTCNGDRQQSWAGLTVRVPVKKRK